MTRNSFISLALLFAVTRLAIPSFGANLYWTAGSTTTEGGSGTWDTSTASWSLDSSAPYTNTVWPGSGNVANIRNSSNGQTTTLTLGSNVSLTSFSLAATGSASNGSITLASGSGFSFSVNPTNSTLVFLSGSLGSTNTVNLNAAMNIADYSPTGNTTFKVFSSSWQSDLSVAGNLNVTGSTSGTKTMIFDTGSGSGTMAYSGSTTASPGGTADLAMQFGTSGATGNGLYTISGNNTAVTAESRIWNGTVVLNSANGLGSAKVVMGGGGSGVNARLVTGTGGLTVNNEVAMGSASTINTVGGEHTSGVSTYTDTVSFSASDLNLTSASGGVVDFDGNLFSSSSTAVTKVGQGFVRLNRTSGVSYNGTTSVNDGALIVNNVTGNGLGAGAVSVGTNTATLASLGGTGTTTSSVTLNGGGSIAPGDINTATLASTIGTLTLGALTWNSDNTHAGIYVDLGANNASSDHLMITGAFEQGSGTDFLFNISDEGLSIGITYTLVEFGSTTFGDASSFGLDTETINLGIDGNFALNGNSLEFTVTSIPEPSATVLLMSLALAVVLGKTRRKAAR